ncbi:M4 family metallopeptidase [Archangium sp.]|uniref:M4 family metallopeptidase n=1 Tax=Archangium sp. TaxID=1872627 RepID=UPI00389A6EBC
MSPTAVTQLQARELSRVATSLAALRTQKSSLGLNERDDFQLAHAQTDRFGQTHAHFQQLHQGVPVWGARAITHLNASGLSLPATTDGLRTGIRVGTQPVLDMAGAISLATIDVMPTGPFGTEPTAELIIYPETRRVNLAPDKPLKKQNAADFQEQVTGYRLAWHVHTELDNPKDGVVHTDFILDARTGEQLKKWKSLETVAAVGQGLSQYSGRVQINTWQRPDGTFELRDTTRTYGEGLRTFDVNHASERDSDPTLTAYLDDDNTWGDGQDYIPDGPTLDDNGQTAAVDAHFGLQMTWDYYQRIHGRFGVDDAGTPTYNRVHIDSYYDNAFWSDSCFCMSYGDGSFSVGNVFGGSKSVTSLDVTGHELSHGVMSRTADLIYSGESGGLNESNSDIFGTMTEFWVRNGRGDTIGNGDKGNWMIGEDLNPFFPFRYMFKPSYDGSSADAWSPDLEKLDVHFSSGPMNRAYYFLSQGADPLDVESDVNSEYLPAGMTGIGNDKAAAIWYRAITAYLYPSANYLAARTASLKAAQDLFGTQSAEYRAVENAFTAINVGYSAGTRDDKTPPSVSAGVSGRAPVLQLHATASDDVGVTRVDFYVDGARVATDTSMPYEGSLDITPFSNGTHQLVAVAFDKAGNTASSTPVTFNVAHTFAQLLKDPGFEAGGEGWEADPRGNINYPADGARTGVGFTWLNGYGDGTVHRDNLYQDVTIPASAQRTSLSFYLNLTTTETGPEVHDYVVVQVRDTSGAVLETLATWSNLDATLGWVQRSFDLSAYAGQTIRIYLEGYEDDVPETATSFKVDDFSLRVSEEYADTEAPAVTASAVVTDSQVGLFADVMDNGHVASVEFFVDGTSRGTSAPSFALALDAASLSNGVHTVVARAVDSAGNVGDSAPVTFYVDVHRQQLVLNPGFEELRGEDPADWAISTDMPGGVFAYPDARFAHAGTNFLLLWAYAGPHTSTVSQSVAIPADSTSAIYSFWLRIYSDAFFDGEVHHTLTARVRDASGAEKTLRTYSNLDVTDGEYLERRFDLSAYKGQTIQLVFEADMTEPMPRGADTEMFLDDVTLFTTSTPDTVKPALTASVDGSSGTLQLNATVSDNVWTSSLRFSVDGSGVAMRPDPKGRYAVPFDSSGLTNGTHTLTVDAVDTAGNTATVKVDFDTRNATTNDTSAPVVDSVTASGVFENYTLEATAHDDTRITHVEYYVDGAFVGQAWSAPFTVSYKATLLTEGAHTVKAVAYDEAGNFGEATTPLIFTAPYLTLSPARVVVAVGGSASFSASVENAADTSVSWAVKDGEPCGSVTNTGAYTASSKAGTCRVVAISNASKGTSATATVIVYTGDINGDGVVDGEDMGLIAQSYGSGSSEAGYSTAADLDADSAVNDNDVTLFVSQFGR